MASHFGTEEHGGYNVRRGDGFLAMTDSNVYNNTPLHPSVRSCQFPCVTDNYKVYLNVLGAGA